MTATALAYQMMLEEKMLGAMIHAEQNQHFESASHYARTQLTFIGYDKTKLPQTPYEQKTIQEKSQAWEKHYFDLLELIAKQVSENLVEIRKKYGAGTGGLGVR